MLIQKKIRGQKLNTHIFYIVSSIKNCQTRKLLYIDKSCQKDVRKTQPDSLLTAQFNSLHYEAKETGGA
jgi:hypothetical protein